MRRCALAACLSCLLSMAGFGLAQELRLEVLTPFVETLPRQTVTLIASVSNHGADAWRGSARLQLPQGWRLLVPAEELALEIGESRQLLFTVVTPPAAAAGTYQLPIKLGSPLGAVESSAAFTVQVRRVSKISLTLLNAPGYVLAQPYTLRFAVQNQGNDTVTLQLSARDNLHIPLTLHPEVVTLAPTETVQVTVVVEVPASLGRSTKHAVTLVAWDSNDPSTRTTQRAEVELIPRHPSEHAALHTFPLQLRLSAGVDPANGPAGMADALGMAELQIRGTGKLWDNGPGQFSVNLRNALDFSRHTNLISYQRPGFRIAAGDQAFGLSPLLPNQNGFGLSAQGTTRLAAAVALGAHTYAYDSSEGAAFGARTSLTLFSQAELAAGAVIPFDGSAPLVSGQLKLFPDLGGDAVLNLDVEYARRWLDEGASSALAVRGHAGTGNIGVNLAWQQSGAQYSGEAHDRYAFSAAGYAQLIPGTNQRPLQARFSAWYRRESAFPGGGLLVSVPVFHRQQLGGAVNGAWQDTRWSLRYDSINMFDRTSLESEQRDGLLFSVDFPLGNRHALRQAVSWHRTLTDESHQPEHLVAYGVGASLSVKRGWLRPYASAEWNLSARALEKLEGGLTWRGGPGSAFDASLEAAFQPRASERLHLAAQGELRFEDHQSLELEVLTKVQETGGLSLQLNAAYNLALDVPIGRRSGVGSLSGVIRDEAGEGVAGLIVRVAGLSAVTQADGRFRLTGVPEGEHYFTLVLDEQRDDLAALPTVPYKLTISADQSPHLQFTLIETAQVHGRVRVDHAASQDASNAGTSLPLGPTRPSGMPVGGLLVELRKGDTSYRTLTDQEGRFSFDRVVPGTWRLVVVDQKQQGDFRLEPPQQMLALGPGEVARPVVELVPVYREIIVVEGGTLTGSTTLSSTPEPARLGTSQPSVNPPAEGEATPPAIHEPAHADQAPGPVHTQALVRLPGSDDQLGFWAPSAAVPPGATLVLYLRSAIEISRVDVSSYRLSMVAVDVSRTSRYGWRLLLVPSGDSQGAIEVPVRITFADGRTVARTVRFELDPFAPRPTDRPLPETNTPLETGKQQP